MSGLRGEISGFRGPHSSGHCYFALKDESAKIEAVIWKFAHARMRFKPQEGLEVIATGKLTTYPGSSKYQIVIESLEPAGIGALMALMEERKKKLAAEGLFDEARKQLLPWLPEVIGVVTLADRRGDSRHPAPAGRSLSAPGAGLAGQGPGRRFGRTGRRRDPRFQCAARARKRSTARCADRRARRRFAGGPVVVQRGDRGPRRRREHDPADLRGRPRDRYHADRFCLRQASADPHSRCRNGRAGAQRIAGRGRDARTAGDDGAGTAARKAAAASCVPPPPRLPAAGDLLAVPRQRLDGAAGSLPRALRANTHAHYRRYATAGARLTMRVLHGQIEHAQQRLTASGERMIHCTRSLLRHRRDRYAGLAIRLKASKLANAQAQRQAIARDHERTLRLTERARRALLTLLQRQQARITHSGQLLAALSYRSVLARGFALVRDEHGHALHAASAVGPAAHLSIEFADGRVAATADADRPVVTQPAQTSTDEPNTAAKPASPKRVAKPVDQEKPVLTA